jgi:hypothetical protein
MKIFFTASQRGKKEFGKYYQKIREELEKLGYKIIDDDIFNLTAEEFYRQLDKGGHQAYTNFYKEKIKHLQSADIVILDCNLHSLSIGFVIEKSLEFHKPTIVLYLKDNSPVFLEGNEDEKLIGKSYNTGNIGKVLKSALAIAKERRDKRFNFFISPSLLDYLGKTSQKLGVTKSTFIRNLIIDHKRKGKD